MQGIDGTIRAYDPETNSFGSYNSDGTTKTFYQPKDGASYFQDQIDKDLSSGGSMINPFYNGGGPESDPGADEEGGGTPFGSGGGGGILGNDPTQGTDGEVEE